MAQSADDELANLRAQRMAQIQAQLEEQAAAQADAELQQETQQAAMAELDGCLLYTSPSPRDLSTSRMPSSA